MGYYQAGDPGLFDFFENTAKNIFSSGSRSMGGEWQAKPGQLSLGRVVKSYIQPIASIIPGMGAVGAAIGYGSQVADAVDSVGSLLSHAPSEEREYDDMATYSGMDSGTSVEFDPYQPYPFSGFDTDDPNPAPEMPLTLSAPPTPAAGGLFGIISRALRGY